jgi:cold shock CspA family protein
MTGPILILFNMAKSKETYNKKEKEKKRLQQKQKKRQKMDERKANKKDGNAMGGMMAYLDENGNLTDTPPDPGRKKTFTLEEIQISVPRQEHTAEAKLKTGTVTYYVKDKGFGFINDLLTNERVFFHINDILEPIEESEKVQFYIERGPRGLRAVQVEKIK